MLHKFIVNSGVQASVIGLRIEQFYFLLVAVYLLAFNHQLSINVFMLLDDVLDRKFRFC